MRSTQLDVLDFDSIAGHTRPMRKSPPNSTSANIAAAFPQVVLLLGGSGFLGSNLGQALMDCGCQIIVVDRVSPRWDAARYQGRGEFVHVAESMILTITKIVAERRVDVVIHLASMLLPGSTLDALCSDVTENMLPAFNLLDVLLDHGVQRFVYVSSAGTVYGSGNALRKEADPLRPMSNYGWMKIAFEEFIRMKSRTSSLEYLILRPSNPYGRYQNLRGRQGLISVILGRILDQRVLDVWGDGSAIRDYIYIDDFCHAVVSLLKRATWNATINIGGGQGTSINEIIELARDITGKPLRVNFKPPRSVDPLVVVLDISALRAYCDDPFVPPAVGMARYWQELNQQR